MGQLSQYIKSSFELDTEFKLNGLRYFFSDKPIPVNKKFEPDEEIYPGQYKIKSNAATDDTLEAEDSGRDKNVDDTKLNPETETEFKDPDPDEPKRTDKGFDERKKNKNQPL